MNTINVTVDHLHQLVVRVLILEHVSPESAEIIAGRIVAAERDGSRSHGLARIQGYVSSLRSGWIDGHAEPDVRDAAPALVTVDARNGFAQIALDAGYKLVLAKASANGIAAIAISNSHHFSALWPDIEPIADSGFLALAFLNTRSRIIPSGGHQKVYGTNPMAFACPRDSAPPMVWDQASSIMSQGDVLLAAKEGQKLPPGVGFDNSGAPTDDPNAVIKGGALAPFSSHKGSNIALMVELLAAALTGGHFGFEDASPAFPGAQTSNAGETILVIDPRRLTGIAFVDRAERLFAKLDEDEGTRLPAARRYAQRQRAIREGIDLPQEEYDALQALCRAR